MRGFRCLFVVLFTFLLPGAVLGQAASPRSDEPEREQARQLYDDAIQAGKRGDYRKAKASLAAAWALLKTWEIAVNLGNAEMKLGQYRDAAEHIAWGIRDGSTKEGEDYAPLVRARALLAEASTHVAKIKLRTDELGATIFVDERAVGKSPLRDPIYLEPGAHVIAARPADPARNAVHFQIQVSAGDDLERTLDLQTPPEVPSAKTEAPAAEVAKPTDLPAAERSGPGARVIVPVTLGGLTAVAGALALTFTLKARAAESAAEDWAGRTGGNCDIPRPDCTELAEARSQRNDANQIANAFWIGTGVLGAATLGSILFWPRSSASTDSARLQIIPRVSEQARGFLITGVFE